VHRRVGRRRGGRSEAPRGAPPAGAGVRARRPGGGGEPGIGSRDAFWWPCAVVVAVVVVPGAVAACRGRGGGPVPSYPACPAGGDPVRAGPGAYAPGIRGADPPGPAAARGIPALRRTGRPVARRPPAGTLARFHRCRRDPGKAALHRLDAWRQLLRHLAAPLDGIRFRPVPAPRAGAGRETAWPPDPARRHPGREPGRGAGGLRAPGPGLRGAGPRRHRPGPLRHGRLAGGAVRAGALHDGSLAQGGGRAVNAWARPLLAALLALSATACSTLSPQQRDRAAAVAVSARDSTVECTRADRCAEPSPLRELAGEAFAETASAPDGQPRHRALILDEGGDALLARINLMRSATRRIDLQTYIFDKDDSARLV